jgi:hypothetical protein
MPRRPEASTESQTATIRLIMIFILGGKARGGAGLWCVVGAIYGGSKAIEWRALEVLGALCGGHGS